MKLRPLPLRYSLPVVLLLGALLISLSSYSYNSWLAQHEVKEMAEHEVLELHRIRNELEYAIQRGDMPRVRYLVAGLGADRAVVRSYLMDDQDRILAATDQATIGTLYALPDSQMEKTTGLLPTVNIQGEMLYAIFPTSLAVTSNELRPMRQVISMWR